MAANLPCNQMVGHEAGLVIEVDGGGNGGSRQINGPVTSARFLLAQDRRSLRVSQRYPARDFQVQYGETDFAFLTRLWQEVGIYTMYFHQDGKHRLVLLDDAGAHLPCAGVYAQVAFHPAGAKIDAEYCDALQTHEALQSGAWVTDC